MSELVAKRAEYGVLGSVLRAVTEELGITQRALARKAGWTETSIHKIEAGVQRVDLVELLDLASALRVRLTELADRFEQGTKVSARVTPGEAQSDPDSESRPDPLNEGRRGNDATRHHASHSVIQSRMGAGLDRLAGQAWRA